MQARDDDMREATILVPADGADHPVAPGSAIVCRSRDLDAALVPVWYEGNLYGAINLRLFHERCVAAAGRMTSRYPTIARAALPREALVPVARLDATRFVVGEILDETRLTAWSGESLASVVGRRIAPGDAYEDACAIVSEEGVALRAQKGLFLTRAGQIVALDVASRRFTLLERDAPATRATLSGLPEPLLRRALGDARPS